MDKIQKRNLSAPETLHWAITYKCPNHCPDCYVLRYSHDFPSELTTDESLRVIDIISEWKILQVAIGGGEPLIRPDILQLLEYMHNKGLAIHLTTGMRTISFELMQSLSRFLSSIQIGIKHDLLLKNGEYETKVLSNLISLATRCGLEIGANLILCQTTINSFESIIKSLYDLGFYRITLLRYKFPGNRSRWLQENPSRESLLSLRKRVNVLIHTLPYIDIRMDCALSFLQVSLPSPISQQYGLRGCVAADRILALTPDGKLFPCSQLIDPGLKCGHILTDDVHDIWNTSPIIHKFRTFRQQQAFRKGACSKCGKEIQCGGCRIFSEDNLGADTGCPLSNEINTEFFVPNTTTNTRLKS